MNKFTVFIVIAILVLTITLALIGGFWHAEASAIGQELEQTQAHFYIEFSYDSIAEAFFTVARYFQLLSLFLPTSLFVTVEVVKAVVAYLIASDWKLISAERAQTT